MAAVEGRAVADFLGRGGDTELAALAGQHVEIVAAMARSYTRGNGFDKDGEPNDEIVAVITTATARLVTNPDQVKREAVGPFAHTPTQFVGWTLAETFVLNRYRKMAA